MEILEIVNNYKNGDFDKHIYAKKMLLQHQTLQQYFSLLKNSIILNITIEENKIVIITKDKVKMILSLDEAFSISEILLNNGDFEPFERKLMLALINDHDVIFDIGANTGWYSLNYAHQFPKAQIYAFEPIRKTFETFQANIELNELNNIHSYNFGFWHKKDILKFNFYDQYSAASSVADLLELDGLEIIECPVAKLDDFVKENNVEKLDFIKCDVEGSELFVFQGGQNTIKKYKPIIFSEMTRKWSLKMGYHPNDIISLMKDMNYSCYELSDTHIFKIESVSDETIGANFIFFHNDKHQQTIQNILKILSSN